RGLYGFDLPRQKQPSVAPERVKGQELDVDSGPCKEVHDPRRSLVRTEADENHARWLSEDAVRIRVLSAIPVREVLDLVCAATPRVRLEQTGELTVVHPRQVGGVVQDLRDSVPCERRALQLEDHQPAALIDADQVEWTASGRKL